MSALRPGTWPRLEYDLMPVPGVDNAMTMPIFLLPLDLPQGLLITETQGGTITLEEIPGFALEIEANSATFPDTSKSGLVSVTPVHADKIPMVPNFGQQPRLIVTIQPAGVLFDPPARLTLPNVEGLSPGEITELYSFDHDAGRFVSIGPGIVSRDGSVITSEPGMGILKGGWHCGGNPQETGCCATACGGGDACNTVSGNRCSGCVTTCNSNFNQCPEIVGNCKLETGQVDQCGCAADTCSDVVNDGDVPQVPNGGCCQSNTMDTQNQCCEAAGVVPKHPIQDLSQCANRVPNLEKPFQFDGCSVPDSLNEILGFDKDNPSGGSDTHFSNASCQLSGVNCTAACDLHDICYQSCDSSFGGRTSCDLLLGNTAVNICLNSQDSLLTRAVCLEWADTYTNILLLAGGFAYNDRQLEVCQCCP